MKKVMLTVGKNEKKSLMQHENRCLMNHMAPYGSKLKLNQRDKSVTFLFMCFSKGVSYALYCFFVIFKFCVKQLTIFERTVVAASDFKTVRWSTVKLVEFQRIVCWMYGKHY